MSILEKLGLARKSKLGKLMPEAKSESKPATFKTSNVVKGVISLVFLGFVIGIFPRDSYKEDTYKHGEVWRTDDLYAPLTYSLLKTDDELDKERDAIRRETPPIFLVDHGARIRIQSRLDSLFENIQPVLEAYAEWQLGKDSVYAMSQADSLSFLRAKSTSQVGLDSNGWEPLLESYAAIERAKRDPNGSTRLRNVNYIGVDIRLKLEHLINEILNDGVLNRSASDFTKKEFTLRDLRNSTENTYFFQVKRSVQDARDYARVRSSRNFSERPATTASQIFNLVIEPNYVYSRSDTENKINEALSNISLAKGAVTKDEVIIRRGETIDSLRLKMLQSLERARLGSASQLDMWKQYIGQSLILIAITMVFFMYLFLYRKSIFNDNSLYLLIFLTLSIIIGANAIAQQIQDGTPYLVPAALAPIILTIIFDSRVGLLITLTIGMLLGLMNGDDYEFVVATISACSLAVYSVRDIKNRIQFFLYTPGLVLGAYVAVYFGFAFMNDSSFTDIWWDLLFFGINAVLCWAAYPLILLMEKIFKVTTDITLLELGDPNRPLLKALMMRAPGTFHHSLQVANLAESAAAAIGANSLLCRVGALYHDIGKMEKPDYFVENQSGLNEHEKLKPRMSAIVIKSHVTTGMKMAEEENLPQVIRDFIPTHHGNSLIKFFFEKAKKESENEFEIREEDFRYDGPIPFTKETGILMLADSVEASSRAMTDPNYQKLENLISRIVDDRLAENQLDECPLTFRDLGIIKETFLNILVGVYHGRVKYPGQDEKDIPKRKNQSQAQKKNGSAKQETIAQNGAKSPNDTLSDTTAEITPSQTNGTSSDSTEIEEAKAD